MSFRDRTYEEERNWAYEEERRLERERQHFPVTQQHVAGQDDDLPSGMAYEPLPLEHDPPAIGPDPIMLMVVQVPHGTEGVLVRAVAPLAAKNSVTLMLWDRRPRRRHRRAMRLLFGRKLGRRLTG